MSILFGLLIITTLIAIAAWAHSRVRATPRDIEWIAGSPVVAPAAAAVYRAYLERVRRFRLGGATVGVVFAVIVGARYEGKVHFGIGEGSPFGDILFCGLAGLIAGANLAEHFRAQEPQSTTIAASLSDRGVTVDQRAVTIARALGAATAAAGIAAAVTGHGLTVLTIAIAGALLQLLAERTRSTALGRRRSVLSPAAHEVDLRLRTFACRAATWLQLAAAVLVAGWAISKFETGSEVLGVIRAVLVISCLIGTFALLHRAAPRPPRQWSPAVA